MKLFEFFGSFETTDPRDQNKDGEISREEKDKFRDDVYFYILDHDDLHKKYFFEICDHILKDKKCDHNVWMPLVNQGCIKFHRENQIKEDPKDIFSKEFREELCEMIDEHYRKDILKGVYHK
jgi:hypothetical protein